MPTVPFIARGTTLGTPAPPTGAPDATWVGQYLLWEVEPPTCQPLIQTVGYVIDRHRTGSTATAGDVSDDFTFDPPTIDPGSPLDPDYGDTLAQQFAIGTITYPDQPAPHFTASLTAMVGLGYRGYSFSQGSTAGESGLGNDFPIIHWAFTVNESDVTMTGNYKVVRVYLPDGESIWLDPWEFFEIEWNGGSATPEITSTVEDPIDDHFKATCVIDGEVSFVYVVTVNREFTVTLPRDAVNIKIRFRDAYGQHTVWDTIHLIPFLDAAISFDGWNVVMDPQTSLALGSVTTDYTVQIIGGSHNSTSDFLEPYQLDVSDYFEGDTNFAAILTLTSDFGCKSIQTQPLFFDFKNTSAASTRNGELLVPHKVFNQLKTEIVRLPAVGGGPIDPLRRTIVATLDATQVWLMRFESTFYAGCRMGDDYVLLSSTDEGETWNMVSNFPPGNRVISWCVLDTGGFAAIAIGLEGDERRNIVGSVSWDGGETWSNPTLQVASTTSQPRNGFLKQAHKSGESHLVITDGNNYVFSVYDFFEAPNPSPYV